MAISRESLNHDGGGWSAVHPAVWDTISRPKSRRVESRIIREFAVLLGPPGFLDSTWVMVDSGPVAFWRCQ